MVNILFVIHNGTIDSHVSQCDVMLTELLISHVPTKVVQLTECSQPSQSG